MVRTFLFKIMVVLMISALSGCIEAEYDPPGGDWSPPAMTRGIRWIRNNPMFLSGLTVSMGPPPARFVNDYFNGFHASAVHLWEDGLPREMDGWAAAGHPGFRFVSWVQPDGTSLTNGELIGGYPVAATGRIGYQIGDEPMTWADFLQYETGFNAVRAHDPDALLILNFSFLAPEVDAMLDHYGQHMDGDVISHDVYTWTSSVYAHLAKFRRAGLRYNKPYWRYLYSHYSDGEEAISESDLRWEAFMGLVYGYSGHTWFIYQIAENNVLSPAFFTRPADFNAQKTRLWDVASRINAEMARLGKAITQMTSTDVRYVPASQYYIPPGAVPWSRGAGNDPYITDIAPAPGQEYLEILVGFFRDDAGEFYVMVQNVRHTHGDFPINSDASGTIRISFDFSGAPSGFDPTRILSLNKVTGTVDHVPLIAAGGNTAYVDIPVAAGDPFLFKYATGVPFAMR
ncbi:MAG: hypothetical protein JRJ54_12090 [Deltaproteobacteria bacterium]|nr:hypothetical protein [Deltaproteobacteria bacterium]